MWESVENQQINKLQRTKIYEANYKVLFKYIWPYHLGMQDRNIFDLEKS